MDDDYTAKIYFYKRNNVVNSDRAYKTFKIFKSGIDSKIKITKDGNIITIGEKPQPPRADVEVELILLEIPKKHLLVKRWDPYFPERPPNQFMLDVEDQVANIPGYWVRWKTREYIENEKNPFLPGRKPTSSKRGRSPSPIPIPEPKESIEEGRVSPTPILPKNSKRQKKPKTTLKKKAKTQQTPPEDAEPTVTFQDDTDEIPPGSQVDSLAPDDPELPNTQEEMMAVLQAPPVVNKIIPTITEADIPEERNRTAKNLQYWVLETLKEFQYSPGDYTYINPAKNVPKGHITFKGCMLSLIQKEFPNADMNYVNKLCSGPGAIDEKTGKTLPRANKNKLLLNLIRGENCQCKRKGNNNKSHSKFCDGPEGLSMKTWRTPRDMLSIVDWVHRSHLELPL